MLVGYIFVIVAVFAGLVKGFCGKKVGAGTEHISNGIWITVVRMVICTVLALLLVLVGGKAEFLAISRSEFFICLLNAICVCVFNVCWLFSVKNQSYMFLSIFLMLGSLVTTVCSMLAFSEKVSWLQWIGISLLITSVFLMSSANKKSKGKMTVKGIITLIVCVLGSCFCDFTQKVYAHENGKCAEVFQFYSFFFALIILLAVGTIAHIFEKDKPKGEMPTYIKKCFFLILLMSVSLYVNSIAKVFAAGYLTAIQLYPVLQALNLVLSAIMATILFKEKLMKRSIFGILIALVGVILSI